jgi:4-aminobutyrate aminotransferase/(S)-3-amino-2-methylpropionate transaminase
LVYATAQGDNVVDVDGNRYVDLASGFGSLLLGHGDARVAEAVRVQSGQLLQSLGDVHPSDAKVLLLERLAELMPTAGYQGIVGQSGADAVSAALKTAALHTGRLGVVAFKGAYHGLSYGPLSICGLRDSYRMPFAQQLNPAVSFVPYPTDAASLDRSLSELKQVLVAGNVGAVVFEPIAGRAGCLVPPLEFGPALTGLCQQYGALLIADEIWTGLGRSGHWLHSTQSGATPDLICLGKGLGGGLPISACLGPAATMRSWSRQEEVVHTSTFAGAPLACAAALATLRAIGSDGLVERSARLGAALCAALGRLGAEPSSPVSAVRGAGLMVGVELSVAVGGAARAQQRLMERGYIVSLGGAGRESLVLTPALTVSELLFEGFVGALEEALEGLGR